MNTSDYERLLGGKPGEPVPEVDHEDAKAVWQQYQDAGPNVAITCRVLALFCSPGADVPAVGYRCGQLDLLRLLSQQQGAPSELTEKIAPLMKDGAFSDAAFRAIAKVPMEWMEPGVIREGPPYDFDQFLKLCAA
jgi:hypothetical protein